MNNFDITDLETVLKGIVRTAGVSTDVYSNRPKATTTPKDNFVVVSVTGRVNDVSAYGQCRVMIYLFARDAQAFKNGSMLSKMYNACREGLPGFYGDKYEFDQTPAVLGDIADDYGYHARVIELYVNIKTSA